MKPKADTISIVELLRRFPDDQSCIDWLEQVRWKGEPVCPHCGGVENITKPSSKPNTYWHKDCKKHFTVTTKTVMHATKTPLQNWIVAIYDVVTARKGVSAMQLSKELGVQYRTAWYMLHRVREACSSGDFKLDRIVEVDETYIGGKERNKHNNKKTKAGRGAVGKQAVIGARTRGGSVKAKAIRTTDGETLKGFVHGNVEPGSTVFTDDHRGYHGLGGVLYNHESVKHSAKEYVNGMIHTNGIESVWAIIKRGYTGTYHHFSMKHCQRYVDEFTFRLNQGNCERDTIDRMEAVAGAMGGKRIPYRELVA
ncbi:MAG: IS1595 family transposase [Gammaproteobacteria bacterium]|nr:IS1595 family transposase [Gammaproteobacteria bacterium]